MYYGTLEIINLIIIISSSSSIIIITTISTNQGCGVGVPRSPDFGLQSDSGYVLLDCTLSLLQRGFVSLFDFCTIKFSTKILPVHYCTLFIRRNYIVSQVILEHISSRPISHTASWSQSWGLISGPEVESLFFLTPKWESHKNMDSAFLVLITHNIVIYKTVQWYIAICMWIFISSD